MKIVCIGGGPAGLYFALLMKKQDPAHDVTVIERNRPDDTFGWGVVFSDQTLGNLQAADAQTAAQILDAFNHWDDIDVHIQRPHDHLGRPRLLRHRPASACSTSCRSAARELGVRAACSRPRSHDDRADYADADLIIASDGLNSRIRDEATPTTFQPDIDLRRCRFVWLGTHEAVRRLHLRLRGDRVRLVPGPRLPVRRRHLDLHRRDARGGLARRRPRRRWSKEEAIAFCERLFAKYLDGHALMTQRGAPARLGAVDQASRASSASTGCTDDGNARRSC